VADGELKFAVEEKYLALDGKEVCRGVNRFRFKASGAGTVLVWEATLTRADGPLTFGPQHEMGFGFRMATPLCVKGGSGSIASNHGGKNEPGNWGRIGQWWDYSGEVAGRRAGILAIAAPDNARPIWSHARDYGFLALNPTGPPPGAKDVPSVSFTIPAGESFHFKAAFVLHSTPAAEKWDAAVVAKTVVDIMKAEPAVAEASVGPRPIALSSGFAAMQAEARAIGKPAWRGLLKYAADLHEKGTHPANATLPYDWEEIGIGYQSRAFGHWDIAFISLDAVKSYPSHAKNQLLNNLHNQLPDGLVPGCIWITKIWGPENERNTPSWGKSAGNPPVWPLAVQTYYEQTKDLSLIEAAYESLVRQIGWFEAKRKAAPEGYWLSRAQWESGIDDDLRYEKFIPNAKAPLACIDATCLVYAMQGYAATWSKLLGKDATPYEQRADALRTYIQTELWDESSGFFYDQWSAKSAKQRVESFTGCWPIVVGAATREQARSVIEKHLLNPERFFTAHPISTIGIRDPKFQLLMWHGPAWNSQTYLAALGCERYGYPEAGRQLLERALDQSALQYERTGTIWEFYDPFGGKPEELKREIKPPHRIPYADYMGHNPLLAMARLYDRLKEQTQTR